MKMKKVAPIFCGVFALVFAGMCVQPLETRADMGNYNFVSISSGAVDSITVNGVTVEALYRPYDSSVDTDTTYSCAAFVKRFYSQVYGRNVSGLWSTTSVPEIDSGNFQETSDPKTGDIIRDNQSVHWAIVKEVSGDTVTVIQQNAWNGSYTKAWVGAAIQKGDPRYSFFRWSESEKAQPISGNYQIYYQKPQVQETTAVISAKVDNPDGKTVRQVGCSLWDAGGNLIKKHVENCQRSESRFNMWYDIQEELGITLTPGTTYQYQFFVIENEKEYPGEVQTITTAGSAQEKEEREEGEPKSTGETDRADVTDDDINFAVAKLRELYSWTEEDVKVCLNPIYKVSVQEDRTVYYAAVETLMNRPASVIVTTKDGKVAKAQWRYEYSQSSDEIFRLSEDLYEQIIGVADDMMYTSRNSFCKDKDNLTSIYDNELKVVRDTADGKPYIAFTVLDAFDFNFSNGL
ncbi:MAG: hypothetical protein ACOX8E_08055 [Ruminococcus sp.]|jgi:hypothetical protein